MLWRATWLSVYSIMPSFVYEGFKVSDGKK
jgi:hypothetical protein